MGKVIEKIAVSRGHEIIAKSTRTTPVEDIDFTNIDVAIEFTAPEMAVKHIKHCVNQQTPVVVGTTAWIEDLPKVKSYVQENNGALLHASNFSIGVNIFFAVNKLLARLMEDHMDSYDCTIAETHHTQKIDAPSGTAVSLANDILLENANLTSWLHEEEKTPEVQNDQLGVTSFRKKGVPGTHVVRYNSEIDTLEIKHTAHNRMGFALGAVLAAEWLHGKTGIYTMADVIQF